ncbi:UNVERIFIED_CONTAM: Polyprotein P3 [Sesamum latifolium]|uniref:Polyprotein P3 n=1 Tax=Sesamum latifolium TaxID=2727402 RepID=A0AAW2X5R9_9LAMI
MGYQKKGVFKVTAYSKKNTKSSPTQKLRSLIPSRMRRQTTLAISCGKVLKVKAQTMIFTQVQSDDEDDRKSVASSNYISNGAEEDFAQIYHVTLIEDCEIEEEDAEDAPVELEEGVKATIDELKEVNLDNIEDPRPIYMSASLTQEEEGTYITLLHEFKDVFAWSYKKMSGLDPKVAVHHLSVKKGARPVKQGQRRFRPKLIPLIETEVNKLIEVGVIREVKYPMWISSIVPVRKKNEQILVCVDFRDLNNACPKDDFPLPVVELMIDTTTGHEALSFIDGSSGYNQIRMAPADEKLTAFLTPKGIYFYKVMPFGLKNAGATYQRAMQRIFDDMLHKNVKCYIDDLVVKSKKREDHLYDLRKVFERLRRYQLKMNPSKCAFSLPPKNFLDSSSTSGKVVVKSKRDWHERIGEALWAYRTTVRTPTQSTPYALVYGVEAVLPLEQQIPSLRIAIQGLTEKENARIRLKDLEALDEKRLEAQQRLKCYQARLSKAFNKKDSLYVVKEAYTNDAYKLITEDDLRICPINGKFLKRYYA